MRLNKAPGSDPIISEMTSEAGNELYYELANHVQKILVNSWSHHHTQKKEITNLDNYRPIGLPPQPHEIDSRYSYQNYI